MITNAKPMACGNCGHGLFRMYKKTDKQDNFKIFAECESCKSTSVIQAAEPQLKIEFGEGSDGCLCDMEPNSQDMKIKERLRVAIENILSKLNMFVIYKKPGK